MNSPGLRLAQLAASARSVGEGLALRGVFALLFAVAAFATFADHARGPARLVGAFAAWTVADGLVAWVVATRRVRAGLPWGWPLFDGVASVAAAALATRASHDPPISFVWIVGSRAIVIGLAQIGQAAQEPATAGPLQATTGAMSVVIGAVLLAQPPGGSLASSWGLGAYSALLGAMSVAAGLHAVLRTRGLAHAR